MSRNNKYKIHRLVSNIPGLAKYENMLLTGPAGIDFEEKTIWATHNDRRNRGITHYKLNGFPLPETPLFVFRPAPSGRFTLVIELLFDLLYLERSVTIIRTGQPIAIPLPNKTPFTPYIPLTDVAKLLNFLTGPNGYLGRNVNINRLMNFMVNVPNNTNAPPLTSEIQRGFRKAISSYQRLSFSPTNPSLISEFTQDLLSLQQLLPPQLISQDQTQASVINKDSTSENIGFMFPPLALELTLNNLPMGIVVNHTRGFVISINNQSASSRFLVVTRNGRIWGYNPLVNANMLTAVNNEVSLSSYTGVTIVNDFLYVTDFFNARIDVFDFNFKPDKTFSFIDPTIPEEYAPFNIVSINDLLYVVYAKRLAPDFTTYESGPGFGYVSIFKPDGTFVKRLISGGQLNVPWGLARAPDDFGKFSGKLLISNHGDGKINVYDCDGKHIGQLKDKKEKPITIDGLWALLTRHRSVYFSSAPNLGADGLIGKIHKD